MGCVRWCVAMVCGTTCGEEDDKERQWGGRREGGSGRQGMGLGVGGGGVVVNMLRRYVCWR